MMLYEPNSYREILKFQGIESGGIQRSGRRKFIQSDSILTGGENVISTIIFSNLNFIGEPNGMFMSIPSKSVGLPSIRSEPLLPYPNKESSLFQRNGTVLIFDLELPLFSIGNRKSSHNKNGDKTSTGIACLPNPNPYTQCALQEMERDSLNVSSPLFDVQ